MYPRELSLPARSFFLFGPRGTGKTTWLRSVLPDAHWVDLLTDRQLIRLMRHPGRFTQEVEALPAGTWIVVDEVQSSRPFSTRSRISSRGAAGAIASR
jgi:predicted AAA+ superfamily ATPase